MESGSQLSSVSEENPHSTSVQFIGTIVALLTLILPLLTIARYSSTAKQVFGSATVSTYPISKMP
jgi:hypothetical protein